MRDSAAERLEKILDRPQYLPAPSRSEIVGAALAALHERLTAILSKQHGTMPEGGE